MNNAKICVQAMMIKKSFMENGAYNTFKRLSDRGFHYVELSQVPMDSESVKEMARAGKEFDIEVAAISGNIEPNSPNQEALATHFDKFISDCEKLDCKYIRIGMLPFRYLESEDKILEFCQKSEKAARELQSYGICLYYHNHHIEFQKFNGKTILDIIKDNAPSMGLELDVHWIQKGGKNPVDVINQNKGRIDLLHLKDYRIKNAPSELFDIEDGDFGPYFKSCFEFAEVGEGNLDMKAIIEAGLAMGTKYLIIEQDDTYGKDPFESLTISADNLKRMGYQDLFK